jgi:hypothetical protein
MAEGQRMTAADVVAQVRDGRLEDFAREAVVLVARPIQTTGRRAAIATLLLGGGRASATSTVV